MSFPCCIIWVNLTPGLICQPILLFPLVSAYFYSCLLTFPCNLASCPHLYYQTNLSLSTLSQDLDLGFRTSPSVCCNLESVFTFLLLVGGETWNLVSLCDTAQFLSVSFYQPATLLHNILKQDVGQLKLKFSLGYSHLLLLFSLIKV